MTYLHSNSPYDSKRLMWAVLIVFLAVWFYMLGIRTLVPTDEGRYAEMAREMVATGDWITLRLNGIKYFEKPPLQNWMNAITFSLFGLGDWQARLWTGLCGLIGIAFTALAAFKIYGRRVAIVTSLILGSSFYWAAMGHINTLDMGLSGMMTIALCGLLIAQRDGASEQERRNYMLWCWAGMALATMSKGLIGFVLPGAVLVLYTLWTRDFGLWLRLHMGKGLLLFFAITVPWFILVWQANPEHPHFFFIHEHFQRFTSTVHKRGGAWYYFVPLLIIGIVPWLGLLFQSAFNALKAEDSKFQPKKMLILWAAFIFFFFSISGSKLPSYILPIFPALALLIAVALEKLSVLHLRLNAALMVLIGAASLAFAPKISNLAKHAYENDFYVAMEPWAIAAAVIALIGGIVAFLLVTKRRDTSTLVLALSAYLAGQVVFIGHDQWGKYSAGVYHLPAINAELKSDTPIFAVGRYEQSLPFYLRRTTILVEHPDEMQFGLSIQPELWIPKRSDFILKWRAMAEQNKSAVAFLSPAVYQDLQAQAVPMRVIGEDPKRVIIALPVHSNSNLNAVSTK
ncbi:glycosyltransferase family 39 protein [Undibacterium cyanobacteriorum]|uniref:Glycosyltransferase family 39 protein n=1 Tax=Undibacterium cyanobacteriorum TaxID=3073561 RepID=A0ABY9RNE7_9BURK|nr:glycosyltransferase family 39 protein [Undibacterium sp. 20NA77.5]WMW82486.1 glycosyltransferase family 39 protein [Undibacterium sp. 20NA77.5]